MLVKKLSLNSISIAIFFLNFYSLKCYSTTLDKSNLEINHNSSITIDYVAQDAPWGTTSQQEKPSTNNENNQTNQTNIQPTIPNSRESQSKKETNIVNSGERDRAIQRCINQGLGYYRKFYWERRFRLLISDPNPDNEYSWSDIFNPPPNSVYPPAEIELKRSREAQLNANGGNSGIMARLNEDCNNEIDGIIKSYQGFRVSANSGVFPKSEEERLRIFSYSDEGNTFLEQYYSQNQCNGIIRLQGWLLGYLPEPTIEDIYRGKIEQPLETISPLYLKGTCEVASLPSIDSSNPPSPQVEESASKPKPIATKVELMSGILENLLDFINPRERVPVFIKFKASPIEQTSNLGICIVEKLILIGNIPKPFYRNPPETYYASWGTQDPYVKCTFKTAKYPNNTDPQLSSQIPSDLQILTYQDGKPLTKRIDRSIERRELIVMGNLIEVEFWETIKVYETTGGNEKFIGSQEVQIANCKNADREPDSYKIKDPSGGIKLTNEEFYFPDAHGTATKELECEDLKKNLEDMWRKNPNLIITMSIHQEYYWYRPQSTSTTNVAPWHK
jgi:hypothetical protein